MHCFRAAPPQDIVSRTVVHQCAVPATNVTIRSPAAYRKHKWLGRGRLKTQAAGGEAPDLQSTAVAAVLSAVLVPPAAAEVYKALQPKRCSCCVGTGFVLCNSCQGRGKQGLTLPGEAKSHSACPTCLAKGRCQCTECDGSGLENWWLWQPASDPGWGPRGN